MGTKLDTQLTASLYRLEEIVKRMQHETLGVSIINVRTLWDTIPDVCSGTDIVTWLKNDLMLDTREEALGVARTLAKYGYIYQAVDSKLTVKDDLTYYRFQKDHFWPTKEVMITNINYAIHLCKRLFSNKNRSNLDTAEMDQLSRLQHSLGHLWEQIWIEAELGYKVDKKMSKTEKIILEGQERAFWNLHKPSLESDYVLAVDQLKFKKSPEEEKLHENVSVINGLERRVSVDSISSTDSNQLLRRSEPHAALESLVAFCHQYQPFDPLFKQHKAHTSTFHTEDASHQDNGKRITSGTQIERWSLSLEELLRDPEGVVVFLKHLEKEHSSENLRFWLACEEFRACPVKKLNEKAEIIYKEFLSRKALYQVNLDSKLMQNVRDGTSNLNHFTFYAAQQEIFRLMRSDSYPRFLKSENYKCLLHQSSSPAQQVTKRGLLSMLTSPQHKV